MSTTTGSSYERVDETDIETVSDVMRPLTDSLGGEQVCVSIERRKSVRRNELHDHATADRDKRWSTEGLIIV